MASKNKPKRSPEEIAALRQELQLPGRTLQMIADREGISRQRLAQLVGPLNRRYPVGLTARDRAEEVIQLATLGRNDEEILQETGLSFGTIRKYRTIAGIRRANPQKKWTPESIIAFAKMWYECFGSLNSTDWHAHQLRKWGHEERLKRFYALGAPHTGSVFQYFPSFNAMLKEAGLPLSNRSRAKSVD